MASHGRVNLTIGKQLKKKKKKMPITLRLHWLDPERWDDVEGLTGRRV